MDKSNSPVLNQRLISLDALRGLDMFFLVGIAAIFESLPKISDNRFFVWLATQCEHPAWQGFTMYDIVFPMFIFIVGAAMPFSFSKRIEKDGKKGLYKHILIRSVTLAIIGVILWQQPGGAHPHWGYYSVLYRIGFSYFFAAVIFLNTNVRGVIYWAFGLSIGYWLLLRFVPVPGYGAGDFSQDGNLVTYIGNLVANNISPKYRFVFSINLITSVSNALFGALTGYWLKSEKKSAGKTIGLLLAGLGFIIFSLLIHLDFPINKKLGSTSFTFLTCGISAVLLAVFYWLIDVKGYKKWAFFFVVVGLNPILIYIAEWLVKFNNIGNVFAGFVDLGNAQPVVFALVLATIKWLFLYYLYKQKVFIKI